MLCSNQLNYYQFLISLIFDKCDLVFLYTKDFQCLRMLILFHMISLKLSIFECRKFHFL